MFQHGPITRRSASMKGGKNGGQSGGKGAQGRKDLPYRERLKIQQREGPKRGESKREWGANERDVPRRPLTDAPKRTKE